MAEFSPGALAFAAFMLAGKTLEAMQQKGLLTKQEAVAAIQAAVDQTQNSRNPAAQEAAQVLAHFYGSEREQ